MKIAIKVPMEIDHRWYEYIEIDSRKKLKKINREQYEQYIEEIDKNYIKPVEDYKCICYISDKKGGGIFSYNSLEEVNNCYGYTVVSVYDPEDLKTDYAVDYIGSELILQGEVSESDIINKLSEGWLKKIDIDMGIIFHNNKKIVSCIVDKLLDKLNGGSKSIAVFCSNLTAGQGILNNMRDVLVCAVKCLPVYMANKLSYNSNISTQLAVKSKVDIFCCMQKDSQSDDIVYIDLNDTNNDDYIYNNPYAEYLLTAEYNSYLSIRKKLFASKKTVDELNSEISYAMLTENLKAKYDELADDNNKLSLLSKLYNTCKNRADTNNAIIKKFTDIAYAIFFSESFFCTGENNIKFFKNWLKPNPMIQDYKISSRKLNVGNALLNIFKSPDLSAAYIDFLFSCTGYSSGEHTEVYPEIQEKIEDFINKKIYTNDIISEIPDTAAVKKIAACLEKEVLKNNPENTADFICNNINIMNDRIKENFIELLSGQSIEWLYSFLLRYVKTYVATPDVDDFIVKCFSDKTAHEKLEIRQKAKDADTQKWLKTNNILDVKTIKMENSTYINNIMESVPVKPYKRWYRICKNCITNRSLLYKTITFFLVLLISVAISHFAVFLPIVKYFGSNISENSVLTIVDIFYIILYIFWGSFIFRSNANVKPKFILKLIALAACVFILLFAIVGLSLYIPRLI